MKHRINELDGALLDAAVAKAEGQAVVERQGMYWIEWPQCDEDADVDHFDRQTRKGYDAYQPSLDWCEGGPIIDRAHISTGFNVEDYSTLSEPWYAECNGEQGQVWDRGPTALVAAMRAYVASKLGEEVELP